MFYLSVLANFTSSFLPALSTAAFVHNQSNTSAVKLDPLLPIPEPTLCEAKYDDYFGSTIFKFISGKDSLDQAIENSDIPCIIEYAKERNINEKISETGLLPLEIAINTGNPETVKTVLALGADLDQPSSHQNYPCFILALKKNDAIASLILERVNLTAMAKNTNHSYFELLFSTEDPSVISKGLKKFEEKKIQIQDLPGDGTIALMAALSYKNAEAVKFLLDQGVDPHRRVNLPEEGIDATCYQAAMTTNKAIKKLFRRNLKATVVPVAKNPWTKEYEDIIRKIISSSSQVEYQKVTNEFGNVFFDPIIDGVYYPLHSIITKMDWRQVFFTDDEYRIIKHNACDFWLHTNGFITRYIFGSFDLNAFLMGQPQYIGQDQPNELYSKHSKHSKHSKYSKYWLQSAGVAHELHGLRDNPDPDEVVCRGQGVYDRAVRNHHSSFISTSTDMRMCMSFAKGAPIVVFDENQGVDLKVDNYQKEHVLFPTTLTDYQFFSLGGQHFYLANALYSPSNSMSLMPASISEYTRLFTNVFHQITTPSASSYTSRFADIIHKIVTSTTPVNTHLVSNQYGQLYYNIEIDGTTYDMYDIISHMDWDQFRLSDETLAAFAQSKYRLWDEQVYTNFYSRRSSSQIVDNPIKLKDIDSTLKLTQRESVPHVCDDKPCDYDTMYSELTPEEKGLIFQYTSVASKPMNSFFKGSVNEFRENINEHTHRWRLSADTTNTEGFDINDPMQWLVYAARLSHTLNKIKPSTTQGPFCRGQSHMDRHVRLEHPAPISVSKNFKLCNSYIGGQDGDLVTLEEFNGKYISPLSFHPDQDEYLGQPAMLDNYKNIPMEKNHMLSATVKRFRTQT